MQLTAESKQELENDCKGLQDTFPAFLDAATRCVSQDAKGQYVVKHIEKLLRYTVYSGTLYAGMLSVSAAKFVRDNTDIITDEDLFLSHMVGWCTQTYAGLILATDDIIDNATARRGKEPWFRKHGVGQNAVNDVLLLQFILNNALKTFFCRRPCYVRLFEEYSGKGFLVASGQTMDCNVHNTPLNEMLSMENYESVIKYKTMIGFQSVIEFGIRMNTVSDPEIYKDSRQLAHSTGHLFQIANDVMDYYHPQGTDIQENKRTWLAAKALQLANAEQTKTILENYGKPDEACRQRVMGVYKELNILTLAQQEIHDRHRDILSKVPTWKLPPRFCHSVLNHTIRLLDAY